MTKKSSLKWFVGLTYLLSAVLIAGIAFQLFAPVYSARAAASLTIAPITWNVIGLDSNLVTVGPNHFPVGARICNTSTSPTTVTAVFHWDDGQGVFSNDSNADPYINLRPGTTDSLTLSLAATGSTGACQDAYFEAEVTRVSSAYNKVRRYTITATDTSGTVSTPTPRELYVEKLISQSRNATTDIQLSTSASGPYTSVAPGGTMDLVVGNTYWIKLVGSTATNGYEQIETFVNFPNTIFQVLSVSTDYTADSSPNVDDPSDLLYGDGCVWVNNPLSPNYRSCTSTGKVGGDITVTYQVKILSMPTNPLTNPEALTSLIYDFSGSSYHYNSDFGASTRYVTIHEPSIIPIAKSFAPNPIGVGGVSTLTIRITNPTSGAISGVNFSDPLPTTPGTMKVASTPNASTSGCGSPTFSPAADATTLSFSNGTIAAGGTCTIKVDVTATATGVYNNQTDYLYINGTDNTGNRASATLTVTDAPIPPSPPTTCATPVNLATWNLQNYTARTSTQDGPFDASSYISGATVFAGTYGPGTGSASGIANNTTFPTGWNNPDAQTPTDSNSWGIRGGWIADAGTAPTGLSTPYFQFAVNNVSLYGGYGISSNYNLEGNWSNAGNWYVLFSTDGTNWSQAGSATWNKQNGWYNIAAQTAGTGSSTVYFRIMANGAQYSGNPSTTTATMYLDNVQIYGCLRPNPPTVTKSFSPDPIAIGSGTSTLTINISNPNTDPGAMLTGISLSDYLPSESLQGTVAVTQNSAAVVGTGTAFSTQLVPGSIVYIPSTPVNLSGSVAVLQGSQTITGTSTAFTTELAVGGVISIDSVKYTVSAIASNTSLTLARPYRGTTTTGLSYSGYKIFNVSSITDDTHLTLTRTITGTTTSDLTIGSGLTLTAAPTTTCSGSTVTGASGGMAISLSDGPYVNNLIGTVNVTNGSATVTGIGTKFTTQLAVGRNVYINSVLYTVSAIASDTSLTLSTNYTGATASGLSMAKAGTRLTGTVGVTNGSATVTGTGTSFTAQLAVGSTVYINAVAYKVSAIASNTSLTLSTTYAGTTASGLTITTDSLNLSGTVTVNNGSTTVTGTGTAFQRELSVGNVITIAGARYSVSAIGSNTSLTLNKAYAGTNASGLTMTKVIGLAGGSSCTITATVKANAAGTRTNVSGYISAAESGQNTGSNGYATDDLTGVLPPIISKVFDPDVIPYGGVSTLTFSIRNPNPNPTPENTLYNVAFSDTYPSGLTNTNPAATTNTCGGSVTAANGGNSVSLSGGTLSGGASCTVTTNVTASPASPPATYNNTSGNVSHVINGSTVNGNTATDSLTVNAASPGIALLKQVSNSASGPWYTSLIIPAGQQVWYKFTVENTGDVPLDPVTITDDTFTPSCTWSNPTTPLPVAVAANDLHISTCIVQNGTAAAGSTTNTAYATGYVSGSPTNSNNDDATYQNGNFGHLPSAYENMNLFNDGGAFHLNGTTFLGASYTATDTDGKNDPNWSPKATDNGVTWTGDWKSGTGYATVNVTCPSYPPTPCYLYAWVDWNNDFDFNDTNETIYAGTVIAGDNNINFPYPFTGNLPAGTYYTRFRVYAQQPDNPQPNGIARTSSGTPIVGEIEDPIITSKGDGGTPTPVTLSYFQATPSGNGIHFEWSTATETGNLGFNLYVESGNQRQLVNSELIPSKVINSLERQDYSYDAPGLAGNTFYIEDISVKAKAKVYGPFLLGETYGDRDQAERIDWGAIKAESQAKAAQRKGGWKHQAYPAMELLVKENGLYRVTYEALRDAGLDLKGVPLNQVALLNRNQPVPIYVEGKGTFGSGSYIEFYGQGLDTLYTDTNVYVLRVDHQNNLPITVENAKPDKKAPIVPYYMETFKVDRELAYSNYPANGDPWYDTALYIQKTPKTWSFPINLEGLAQGSTAPSLSISMWGGLDLPQTPDHHVVVQLNGVTVSDERFDGIVDHPVRLDLPAGLLREGSNILQLTMPADMGAANDLVFLDSYSITYPRVFNARAGRLTFKGAGQSFRVVGLPTADVLIYRMNDDGKVVRLKQAQVDSAGTTFNVLFAGTNQSATYLVSTANALLNPVIQLARPEEDITSQPAQYLIISHPDFINNLQPLIQARQVQGLTVRVVDVEAIIAQFGYGIFDPQAIHDFITYAANNLGVKYVLLVGGDTYDYRNYLGAGSISFIPSLYTRTSDMATVVPSDPLYTDINNDGMPDLPIGRFPVRTSAEVDAVIAKTLVYANKNYNGTAVFAADKIDGTISFSRISEAFIAQLPQGWNVERAYLDTLGVTAARNTLRNALNRGVALTTYVGHSAAAKWTNSGLFNTSDAAALTNAGRPTVVVQWGCWNTYYVSASYNTMAHKFLLSGDRGAAAVLGATTLAEDYSEEMLGRRLMPYLVQPGMTVGEAVQLAKQDLARTNPDLLDVLLGWTLLGDPALVVQP